MANEIDLLSGKVVIDAPRPQGLEEGLVRFFENPNDARWGPVICRYLYHECLHFWQFLGYGFVASLVAQEWERLLNFETTGHVAPRSSMERDYGGFRGGGGFSARQLLECWTRYWDVHTRGASAIIADEDLEKQINFPSSGEPFFGTLRPYTGEAFDFVMLHGPLSGLYERTYNWTLEAFSQDSYTTALIFPLACHGAFLSQQPVAVFERITTDAASLIRQNKLFSAPLSRIINMDWAIHSKDILARLLTPVYHAGGLKPASGFSTIAQTSLANHPVYRDYFERQPIFTGYIKKIFDRFRGGLNGSREQKYNALIAIFAHEDSRHVFLCPGEPMFRDILATAFPPVRVAFADCDVDIGHVPMRNVQALTDPTIVLDDYSVRIEKLCKRVTAFRDAELAAPLR